jgi:predicted molibdopterin-dependent oxidoreductase YjgC
VYAARCVAYCPTGALDDKPSVGRGRPERLVTTTCAYCGVGCQLDLNLRAGKIIRVTSAQPAVEDRTTHASPTRQQEDTSPTRQRGDATGPSLARRASVNGLQLCVKGRYGYDFVHHPERLTGPLVRRYLWEGRARRGASRDAWVPVDWETALDLAAARLVAIKRESGARAIGVLSSAKCTNEENCLMRKFARQVLGTHNVDHCARLCHSSTVAGLAACFGSGAMSNTMQDIAHCAKAIFIIGSNTTEQHPVFGAQLRQAVLQRGVQLVVADPRRIPEYKVRAVRVEAV